MKPTWKILHLVDGPNCKCLICGKEFTFLGEGHFNMRLIKCPTCNQEVWVPRCPNGCPSIDPGCTGNSVKFDDYIPEDVKNEEHY